MSEIIDQQISKETAILYLESVAVKDRLGLWIEFDYDDEVYEDVQYNITQSMLQRFLRERLMVFVYVIPVAWNNFQYNYIVNGSFTFSKSGYNTYELALEQGLKAVLAYYKSHGHA